MHSNHFSPLQGFIVFQQDTTSLMEENYPGGRNCIVQALKLGNVPEESLNICLASITDKTINQYNVGLQLWWKYCKREKINVFDPSVPAVLKFLTMQFNKGSSFSSLNSYRAALSQIFGPNLSEDFRIRRFFKGLSSLRPPKPKYNDTWDPIIVLTYIKTMPSILTLEQLTLKTAILLALATGQRVQTLAAIELCNIKKFPDRLEIRILKRLKTTNTTKIQPTLILPFFPNDCTICPAKTLLSYIDKTETIRGGIQELFVTFKKPYHAVSTQTISRWLKTILKQSGLDVTAFSAHSTRHASTSAAARKGISYDNIRLAAGWTEKSQTFAKFYNKPLAPNANTFATAVFSST